MIEDLHPALHQTPVATDPLNRQWAGVDLSEKTVELVKGRIRDDLGLFKEIVHRTDLPRRDNVGTLPSSKPHKPDLYGEQGGRCAGCGQHFALRNLGSTASSRARVADSTTRRTSNSCAAAATGSRVTAGWSISCPR